MVKNWYYSPVMDAAEGFFICDVIHKNESHRSAVVGSCNRSVPFLPRRVLFMRTNRNKHKRWCSESIFVQFHAQGWIFSCMLLLENVKKERKRRRKSFSYIPQIQCTINDVCYMLSCIYIQYRVLDLFNISEFVLSLRCWKCITFYVLYLGNTTPDEKKLDLM